jgi:hypothetical protein
MTSNIERRIADVRRLIRCNEKGDCDDGFTKGELSKIKTKLNRAENHLEKVLRLVSEAERNIRGRGY